MNEVDGANKTSIKGIAPNQIIIKKEILILQMMKSLAVGAALASATLAESYVWPTVNVEYKTKQLIDDNASVERSEFLFLARGTPA